MCFIGKDIVDEVVAEFIQDRKSFTAFDITKEARKRSIDHIFHYEARHLIHQIMEEEIQDGNRSVQ